MGFTMAPNGCVTLPHIDSLFGMLNLRKLFISPAEVGGAQHRMLYH